jgi:hypothetical protein
MGESEGGSRGEPREALELVHHHPGRLRLRASVFQGETDALTRVRARLDAITGVAEVQHNARTGSLLIHYEPGMVEPDAIVAAVALAADLDPPRPHVPDPKKPALVAIGVTRELNAAVTVLTGGRADLKTLVPAAMVGVGVYSFFAGKGPRLPRWDNLVYWGYQIFSGLHREEIERATTSEAAPAKAAASESAS